MGVVSASDDVNDTISISQAEDSPNQPINDSNVQQDSLQANDEDELGDSAGDFVDASEAYDSLNEFRCENGVWQWNSDDATKTCFNTEDTVWLKPLERDAELEETAKIRAMELYRYYSHTRPDGTGFFTAFPESMLQWGENIAIGGTSGAAVTEDWKEVNDPYDGQGHRRNMIDPKYNCVGIAGFRINGAVYWVQDFGCRHNPQAVDEDDVFRVDENSTETPKFSMQMPIYATGSFIIKVNGREILDKSVFQGKANITLYGLNAGMYDVELIYSGDHNYKSVNRTYVINATGDDSTSPSFTYLNTLIKMADGEVALDKDYSYDADMDSDFRQGILIPKGMTIDGAGHRIDAKNQARIFYIADGATLKNLNFANGFAADYGGAILSIYVVTLQKCTFANSSAGINGGAIYSCNQIRSYDSTFTDNTARINGGALFGEAAVIIERSSFINNQAHNFGGAAYAQATLSSQNSNYTNNTNLQLYSSVMRIIGSPNNLDDEYSLAFANASQNNSVIILDRDWTATQTIWISASNVVIDGNGHRIDAQNRTRIFYITGNNVTIRNISLCGGNSIGEGGAILSRSRDTFIIASNFTANRAETGAAIFSHENIFVESSGFFDNVAEAGGAIFSDIGNVTAIRSLFSNNDASYGGGSIYTTAMVNVRLCTFTGSDVLNFGGAIFTNGKDLGKVTIRDSTFANNTSRNCGGVLVCSLGADISNSTFADNSAGNKGGALYVYGGNVLISGSRFSENTANESGAAVFCENVEVRDSSFTNNGGKNARTFSATAAGSNSIVIENGVDVTSDCIRPVENQKPADGSDSKAPSADSKSPVKKPTKITAGKKTFKAKAKTKKYAITLKSGKSAVKKVQVILKIKGKTYKATTNGKGKALFKIKKLSKKGKYTATITFKGNKNYRASSKKVKIIVK